MLFVRAAGLGSQKRRAGAGACSALHLVRPAVNSCSFGTGRIAIHTSLRMPHLRSVSAVHLDAATIHSSQSGHRRFLVVGAACENRQRLRPANSLCCCGFGFGEGVRMQGRAVLLQQRRCFGRANLYLSSKQKSDTKRAGTFTKLCNEIWSAAKDGGTDPDGNHRLARAISKAKDANVPKANIERALARATETADAMEEVTYELYAPGGVGLIVAANTDSPNRTIRALKGVVKDTSGASMAAPGAVAWQFERTGLLRIAMGNEQDMERLMELAIDNGATDVDEEPLVETDGRQELSVLCEPAELGRLCNEVRAAGFAVTQVMRPYLPTSTVDVERSGEEYDSLVSFLDDIDAIEDVTDVFSNCKFS